MSEAVSQTIANAGNPGPGAGLRLLREWIDAQRSNANLLQTPENLAVAALEWGLLPSDESRPEFLPAQSTAFELGHPTTLSHPLLLLSDDPGQVVPDRITLIGPDFPEIESGARLSYAQVILAGEASADRIDVDALEGAAVPINRVPGVMIRALPGRCWLRVDHRLIAQGFDLRAWGTILLAACREAVPASTTLEALIVIGSREVVETLSPVAALAELESGRLSRLQRIGEDELECDTLDCEGCEAQPVCDTLQDVLTIRRRDRRG